MFLEFYLELREKDHECESSHDSGRDSDSDETPSNTFSI